VGIKTVRMWKPDANGHLKEHAESKPADAPVGTDLLLKYALTRRGLALEVANVCRFEAHSLLVECFFDAMLAPPLPGYAKVTRNQVKNADVMLWRLIAKDCKDGLSWNGLVGSTTPFEESLKVRLYDPTFRYALMPLPTASEREPEESSHLKRKRPDGQDEDKGKGKGKARGKEKNTSPSMQGKVRTTSAGEPLCFNFNTKGCPNAEDGARCKNGWHTCAEPGCGKPHAMHSNH